jgi:transposase InsO family protein
MPWGTNTVSELRTAFAHAVRTAGRSVSRAARDFGISRKTAYKWLARFDAQQPMSDGSRRPHRSPSRTPDALEQAVLEVRERFGWGPRKIRALLANSSQPTPSVRTIADILRRHRRIAPTPAPEPADCQRFERARPNELWQLDFKGWVEVGRTRVSPLSILDDHSRFLLALRPCTDLTMGTAWNVLWEAFGDYGLPEAILCDNPGVSWFESRLLRLGIRPVHGRPYHPQTQGKVERLHGTLVREVYPRLDTSSIARFAAGLDHWRQGVYNPLRPHEALGDQPPITRWRPSSRPRPDRLPAVVYPPGSVLRRVGSNGIFHYHKARILAGQGLVGEHVRVEESDGRVVVYYTSKEIRRIPLDGLQQSGIV